MCAQPLFEVLELAASIFSKCVFFKIQFKMIIIIIIIELSCKCWQWIHLQSKQNQNEIKFLEPLQIIEQTLACHVGIPYLLLAFLSKNKMRRITALVSTFKTTHQSKPSVWVIGWRQGKEGNVSSESFVALL